MRIHAVRRLCLLLVPLGFAACSDSTAPKLTVSSARVQLTGCPSSASPLPGWVNCTGTITLSVSGTPSSGYLSVYMNYGSSGSFYHGSTTAVAGSQSYAISVVNDYVPQCFTSLSTTVDVYDGPPSASNAPLVTSIPIALTGTC